MFKLLFINLIFITEFAFSQKYNSNWVFGDSAGLVFEDGTISNFKSSIYDGEPSATISDSLGNLLFYTNGQSVWNANNALMPNGTELQIGLVADFISSETQGVLIAPKPNSNNLYYIFQLQDNDPYGIKYSIVDMLLDGGKGDLIEKNIVLYENDITEKMQLVQHGNGRDWWLICHEWPNLAATEDSTYIFTSFLITNTGILGPYKQTLGPKAYLPEIPYFGWGEMTIDQSGNKLIYLRQDKIDIYDFNRCTGIFENWLEITNLPHLMHYGCSVSPDGTKIYVSTVGDDESLLFQFSLTAENVDSSRQLIFENTYNNYAIGQHELGPDGKIYIAMYAYGEFPNDNFTSKNQNLCVINYPNEIYPLCNFDTNTISLGERRVIGGLPNMPNYNLGALIGSECDTLLSSIKLIDNIDEFIVSPNPAYDEITIRNQNLQGLFFDISFINSTGVQSLLIKNTEINKSIDISELSPGIYFITLYLDNNLMMIDKLIIQ